MLRNHHRSRTGVGRGLRQKSDHTDESDQRMRAKNL